MEVIGDTLCSDDADMVTEAVKKWIEQGRNWLSAPEE